MTTCSLGTGKITKLKGLLRGHTSEIDIKAQILALLFKDVMADVHTELHFIPNINAHMEL